MSFDSIVIADDGTTPPLIPGASESNIQTCEFEVHSAGMSEGAHTSGIEQCQKEKSSSLIENSDSSSVENERSKDYRYFNDKESSVDQTDNCEVCSETTALNNNSVK